MPIEWSEQFELGVVRMDAAHREFVELLGRLDAAADAEFISLFGELLSHTKQHFSQENRWMVESHFPPVVIHRGEHARVLAILYEAVQQAQTGDVAAGRDLVNQLPVWFEQHAATMDLALARYLESTGYIAI